MATSLEDYANMAILDANDLVFVLYFPTSHSGPEKALGWFIVKMPDVVEDFHGILSGHFSGVPNIDYKNGFFHRSWGVVSDVDRINQLLEAL